LYVEYVKPMEFIVEIDGVDIVDKVQEFIKKYGI
jgi:hypothetical protein